MVGWPSPVMALKDAIVFTWGFALFLALTVGMIVMVAMSTQGDTSALSLAALVVTVAFLSVVKTYFQLFVRIWLYFWYKLMPLAPGTSWGSLQRWKYILLVIPKMIVFFVFNVLNMVPLFTWFTALMVPDKDSSPFYLDRDVQANVLFSMSGVDTATIVRNLTKQNEDLARAQALYGIL